MKTVRRIPILLLALALSLLPALAMTGCGSDELVLNVYNWGEYMSLGEEGALNSNKAFEQWYEEQTGKKVRVNYTTYDSNEALRARLESGAVNYDVIIPSDYMIEYFVEHDMLEELNFDNIPNYKNIDDAFKGLFFDPDEKYSVPYTYGMVGVIYDAKRVDEADTGSWELLWNEKYSGSILQFNNSRDGFGSAMYRLGIDVNTTDHAQWEKARDALREQKPLVKSWVMDEVFNLMETGEAAVATYYAGDYFTMVDDQADSVDLQFYYPKDEGGRINTNLYVDSMCVPKGSKNKDVAEAYINFMLTEEPAVANAEQTYYASPNKVVYENAGYKEDLGDAYDVLYPSDFDFRANYEAFAYRNLDDATLKFMNELWDGLFIE